MSKANFRFQPRVYFGTYTLGKVDILNIIYSSSTVVVGLRPGLLYFETTQSPGSWAETLKVRTSASYAVVIAGCSDQFACVLLNLERSLGTGMLNGIAETLLDEESLTHYSAHSICLHGSVKRDFCLCFAGTQVGPSIYLSVLQP